MAIRKFGNLLPLIKLGYGSIGERNLFIYGPVSKLTASLSQKFNLLFCSKSSMDFFFKKPIGYWDNPFSK